MISGLADKVKSYAKSAKTLGLSAFFALTLTGNIVSDPNPQNLEQRVNKAPTSYHVDSYYDINIVDEDADYYWVQISLHENGCEWTTGCTPREGLTLTITPCPPDVECETGTYTEQLDRNIFDATFNLKLLKWTKYNLGGNYSIQHYQSVMGGICNTESYGCYDNDLSTGFPEGPIDGLQQMGLYADELRSNACITYTSGMHQCEMWIWCAPNENGMRGVEFMLDYPDNIIPSTHVKNHTVVALTMGDFSSGISAAYSDCQDDWHWIFKQTLYLTSQEASVILIKPHPDTGEIRVTTCNEGYPVELAGVISNLYLNNCGTSTEEASWGRIKQIYK